MTLNAPAGTPAWGLELVRQIQQEAINLRALPTKVPVYTVLTMPSAVTFKDCLITVSDEAGGYTQAFSDGTNWRRVQDRAIVS